MTGIGEFFVAVLLAGCACVGCAGRQTAQSATASCLGDAPVVSIAPGRIGALQLDLPLDSLRRLCAGMRDTLVMGDELLDTAVVFSQPGLSVVAVIATVLDSDGIHEVRFDSLTHAKRWRVFGTAGVLPGDVPLTALWRDLVQAYGPPDFQFRLDDEVFIEFCDAPGIRFSMMVPWPILQTTDRHNAAALDSVAGDSPIAEVYVAASPVGGEPRARWCR